MHGRNAIKDTGKSHLGCPVEQPLFESLVALRSVPSSGLRMGGTELSAESTRGHKCYGSVCCRVRRMFCASCPLLNQL